MHAHYSIFLPPVYQIKNTTRESRKENGDEAVQKKLHANFLQFLL
jgi:hypothetical protein